tara:strand:+ start:263 stop:460 length:198 start_codon:yes stop_codon:yes gene_type:complete
MIISEKRVFAVIILYTLGFVFRGVWSDFLGVKGFVKDSKVAILAALLLFQSLAERKIKKETQLNY